MKPEYKPLYIQVMEGIKSNLSENLFKSGQAIPSEAKLANEFEVSISTIRQAISVLVSEGILEKKQGKGTFLSTKKKNVTFLTWLTETPKSQRVLSKLIKMVESKYPDITIEVIPTSYFEAKERLERLIAAGNAPDIAHIVSHWTSSFAASGAFVELEEVMSKEHISIRSEPYDLRGGRFGGKLYSVSWGLCPITMIANMDVLKKCGVDSIPEVLTFSEWDHICNKVYSNSNRKIHAYGLPYDDGEADFLRVYQFLQAFGGEYASREGELVLRSPENIRALKWLQAFCKDGKVKFDSIINIRKSFVDDKVAFMHDGPWSKMWLSEVVGEKFDTKIKAVLTPVYPAGREKAEVQSKSWNYNHALAVLTQSEQVASAINVIDAVTLDPEISGYYYEQSGHLPVSKGVLSEKLENSEFYKVFSKQLEGSDFINAENIYFPKAMDFCIDAMHNIFMKDAVVATELAEKQHYLEILYGY